MLDQNSADFVGFFFGSQNVPQFDTLEITHPSFSKAWYLVRNNTYGLDAKLETGVAVQFEWCPMRLSSLEDFGSLDYGMNVTLGELGEILPEELERARAADTLRIRPTVIYRAYRADQLDRPMIGPIRLEAQAISRTREGAAFDAVAPSLNVSVTGELYRTDRFEMLLGFL